MSAAEASEHPPSREPGSASKPAVEHPGGLELPPSPIEDENLDRRLAEIEMIGEESAAGLSPRTGEPISPDVRYLHASRTINQLVADRNRAVGILLFVASLLFGASTALLNAPATVETIIPLAAIKYWCLPVTFGVLALLSILASLILIRTRIGLIYEVAKMNTLMGIPYGRVKRVNPFSIFFLMHFLVASLGGISSGMAAGMLLSLAVAPPWPLVLGLAIGLAVLVFFQALYVVLILRRTSDERLSSVS